MQIIKANPDKKPDISFIIPVHNEEKYLPYTLEAIVNQKTDLKAEVIVIDDRSTDKTVEIGKKYNCTIYRNIIDTLGKRLNVTQMRNFGFEKSSGKTIMHLDGDTAFSENFVEKMVKPIIKNEVDTTLVFYHEPLEVKYPVLPEKYSKSYAFFLHNLPHFLWGKIPVRFFIWIGNWVKTMFENKKFISLLSIPDRVNGSAIITKREIINKFGGWKLAFGAHSDTDYSLNVIKYSRKVRWILGVILYYSYRRYFPETNMWIFDKLKRPFVKIFYFLLKNLFKKDFYEDKHIDKKEGYKKPEGKR